MHLWLELTRRVKILGNTEIVQRILKKKRCWPTSSQDLYITCNIGVKTSKTDAIRSNPGDLQVELAIMFPYLCTTHGGTQKALVPV
jgi:hypothetical protein